MSDKLQELRGLLQQVADVTSAPRKHGLPPMAAAATAANCKLTMNLADKCAAALKKRALKNAFKG